MTKFHGGPADGVSLLLRRAPVFLRAVYSEADGWDALDQIGEAPRRAEQVHVYRRFGSVGTVHVRGCRKGGKTTGGFFVRADYRYYHLQPGVNVAAQAEWENWCLAAVEEERKAAPA